jgi:hypothetical protein
MDVHNALLEPPGKKPKNRFAEELWQEEALYENNSEWGLDSFGLRLDYVSEIIARLPS